MEKRRVFPIGKQNFPDIITSGFVYVDKTEHIHNLSQTAGRFFLSRPRRFGKSLLCSTLHAYFEGRKELFKGLAIDKLEKEWKKHPVFHFDFSTTKYLEVDDLRRQLDIQLSELEELYGVNPEKEVSPAERLSGLIKRANEQTDEKVVIIIDEYDAPLHDTISNPDLKQQLRQIQRQFFSPLKHQDCNLHFIFITGITKFSQMSIFSELNNLKDISFMPEYESICGITENELTTTLREDIEAMAVKQKMSCQECLDRLKFFYDGYHFSDETTDVYNPFSLINALSDKRFDTYWFSTGTPTFLLEMLTDRGQVLSDIEGKNVLKDEFDTPTDELVSILPVLYQSGYLTIKKYDNLSDRFTLGIPNEEVRRGLASSLTNYYLLRGKSKKDRGFLMDAYDMFLQTGDTKDLLEPLQTFLKGTSYSLLRQNESLYQSIFYTWLIAAGADVQVEKTLADGRIDILLKMDFGIWIFEFKYNKSADEAIDQIRTRRYMDALRGDSRPVHLIGVNINKKKRNIDEWKEISDLEMTSS